MPTEDWRAEVIFPKPRILRRIIDGTRADWWLYTSGEIGGNSWAIVRDSGNDDIATYKDLRFILRHRAQGRFRHVPPVRAWLCVRSLDHL